MAGFKSKFFFCFNFVDQIKEQIRLAEGERNVRKIIDWLKKHLDGKKFF